MSEADVGRERQREEEPVGLAILGHQPESEAHGVAWRRDTDGIGRVCDEDGPRRGDLGPEESPEQLGAPGAHEPGQSHDLAAPHVEGDVTEAAPAEVACPQDALTGRAAPTLPTRRDVASNHQADHLVPRQETGLPNRHDASVPQDGDSIGDSLHLVQSVRDEHDASPGVPQPAHLLEQSRRLRGGEGRGRLVEDQEVGGARQGRRDLHELPLGQTQCVDQASRVEGREADGLEGPAGIDGQATPIEDSQAEPALRRETIEEEGLGHGQGGDQAQLLRDERYSRALALRAGPGRVGFAAEAHGARIGPGEAGHDPGQGGLSGPVLSDESDDLSGSHVEGDGGENGGRVGLREVRGAEQRRGHCSLSEGSRP